MSEDIATKRSILLSARLRFSPETQPIRETAIDRMIEQNLFAANAAGGLTLPEALSEGARVFAGAIPTLARQTAQESFNRLIRSGRITSTGTGLQTLYSLTEASHEELRQLHVATDTRFTKATEMLFRNAPGSPSQYAAPLLECLCIVFSRLGETYVRLIKGDLTPQDLMRSQVLLQAVEDVLPEHPSIDTNAFSSGVLTFFRDSNPEFDAIKWNLAQNCYISKAIGLDPSGTLLSSEVFGNASFYLDTNVMIDALEPSTQHHQSFKGLNAACRHLGITLLVAAISREELRRVVEYQLELIEKVHPIIPDSIAPKINSVFFQLYWAESQVVGDVDPRSTFASFLDPSAKLARDYGTELIDDPWFSDAETDPGTTKLAGFISQEYEALRGRRKGNPAALHDALILRWIQREREKHANTWLVTLDQSLPPLSQSPLLASPTPLAITLDALLQWITPLAVHPDSEDDFAAIFADAVRYRLLPQEEIFDLRDFLMFAEMEWSVKELPPEDVEECIRYLRANASTLNPALPTDREKIAWEMTRFFADPGRKYKESIADLEARMACIEQESSTRIKTLTLAIDERDETIQTLTDTISEELHARQLESTKKSARRRLAFVILTGLLVEAGIMFLADRYAVGSNTFQRVLSAWPYMTAAVPVFTAFAWLFVGKERLRSLGLPFAKPQAASD